MSHGRIDEFSLLSPADDQDVRVDRLDGGDCFERRECRDETDNIPRMKLKARAPARPWCSPPARWCICSRPRSSGASPRATSASRSAETDRKPQAGRVDA